MADKGVGLIQKYVVERVDGKRVQWCFVLEEDDPITPVALSAYAERAHTLGYMELAADLRGKIMEIEERHGWQPGPFGRR